MYDIPPTYNQATFAVGNGVPLTTTLQPAPGGNLAIRLYGWSMGFGRTATAICNITLQDGTGGIFYESTLDCAHGVFAERLILAEPGILLPLNSAFQMVSNGSVANGIRVAWLYYLDAMT